VKQNASGDMTHVENIMIMSGLWAIHVYKATPPNFGSKYQ